jgi:hypothetical protein
MLRVKEVFIATSNFLMNLGNQHNKRDGTQERLRLAMSTTRQCYKGYRGTLDEFVRTYLVA